MSEIIAQPNGLSEFIIKDQVRRNERTDLLIDSRTLKDVRFEVYGLCSRCKSADQYRPHRAKQNGSDPDRH